MTKTDIAKGAVSLIVGTGTAQIVRSIIKNNVTNSNKVTDQAAMIIATYVLGAMAADASKVWTDAKIDKLIEWYIANVKDKIHS